MRYFRDLNADYLKSIIAKIFEDGSRREIFDEANADLAKISRTYANKTQFTLDKDSLYTNPISLSGIALLTNLEIDGRARTHIHWIIKCLMILGYIYCLVIKFSKQSPTDINIQGITDCFPNQQADKKGKCEGSRSMAVFHFIYILKQSFKQIRIRKCILPVCQT